MHAAEHLDDDADDVDDAADMTAARMHIIKSSPDGRIEYALSTVSEVEREKKTNTPRGPDSDAITAMPLYVNEREQYYAQTLTEEIEVKDRDIASESQLIQHADDGKRTDYVNIPFHRFTEKGPCYVNIDDHRWIAP